MARQTLELRRAAVTAEIDEQARMIEDMQGELRRQMEIKKRQPIEQSINRLRIDVERRGLTLVPLSIHWNERGIAKVDIGLARGKKLHDKRADLKERDDQRDMQRALRVR